jgi:hypothetical protein
MAKSLNLKIKKAKLVSTLSAKLKDLETDFKTNPTKQDKYEKDLEDWTANIIKLIKNGKASIDDADENHYYGNHRGRAKAKTFSVTVSIPKALVPSAPEKPALYEEYRFRNDKEAITNALRMLELSDDEYVSAGTVRSISEYL